MPSRYLPSREMLLFLGVGGAGYVTDVLAFNWLRDQPLLLASPMLAKVAAVAVAMVVTYVGNRALTWRDLASSNRHREVALFAVFNVVGLLFSVLALHVSHDLLGLTGRTADNISGNVVGVGLGTVFRFWAYRRFVFVGEEGDAAVAAEPVDRSGRRRTPTVSGPRTQASATVVRRRRCHQASPSTVAVTPTCRLAKAETCATASAACGCVSRWSRWAR